MVDNISVTRSDEATSYRFTIIYEVFMAAVCSMKANIQHTDFLGPCGNCIHVHVYRHVENADLNNDECLSPTCCQPNIRTM